jgi:hypothetical protein
MLYTVYKITNLVNNRFYIGVHKTTNPFDAYLGSGKMIRRAINKYGKSNFKKDILHIFDNSLDAFQMEANLVETFRDNPLSYNIAPGGMGGMMQVLLADGKNVCISEQRRRDPTLSSRAIEKAKKVKRELEKDKNSEWYRSMVQNISKARKNSKFPSNFIYLNRDQSFQEKRKLAFSKSGHGKGQNNSQFGTMWITDGSSSIKVPRESSIPDGWRKGRKMPEKYKVDSDDNR